jgi:hypothetical protein
MVREQGRKAAAVWLGMVVASTAAVAAPMWESIEEANITTAARQVNLHAGRYRTFRVSAPELGAVLDAAPPESAAARAGAAPERAADIVLEVPMPDGVLRRFRIEQSPVVESGLLDRYPELRTWRGQGIDDPAATARFDFLPSGFHAIVLSPGGTVLVDPYADGDRDHYVVYHKRDALRPSTPFVCAADEDDGAHLKSLLAPAVTDVVSGTQLRTYRLALAATNEYAVAVGGNTIAGTLAAEVLIMNRVNAVYERDLAIHMNIVAHNDRITFAGNSTRCGGACTAANDPYTNDDGAVMLAQNQATIDAAIGSANYDIGHVFSTGGGGIATLNVPCSNTGKARGVTGLPNPVGDAFAIDYVAHEMGHQFGGFHTFNGTVSNCAGNRSSSAAFEVGSGITIMAYAGICGNQDLADHSIDTFHVKSLEQIVAFSQTGSGNACAAKTTTGNTPPTVSAPGNFTIPHDTPFALTATAADVDGDTITYDWQEYDLDGTSGTTDVPNSDADGTPRPIFRPYLPTASGTRYFPSLQYILNNANVPPATTGDLLTGERLPAIGRTMTFKVVARDNRANGGGISSAISTITVSGTAGPFALTAPNTSVTVTPLSAVTVTWNVANTAASPVNATNVRITLSTDGGQTFPTVLAASVPNDGSHVVAMPNVQTSTARIRVEAVGNIFFDVSDVNFAISGAPPAATLDLDGSTSATRYDALTDGVLLLRYLDGAAAGALTAGALGATASRNATAVKAYVDARLGRFDIDGDGSVDPRTDGLLALRYLLGYRGDALIADAVTPGAPRSTSNAIEAYLLSLMP